MPNSRKWAKSSFTVDRLLTIIDKRAWFSSVKPYLTGVNYSLHFSVKLSSRHSGHGH